MVSFFIIPFEYDGKFTGEAIPHIGESHLVIDIVHYRQQLVQDWKMVQFQPPTPISILIWTFATESIMKVKGPYRIHGNYKTLSMDVPDGEFALWHRLITPQQYRLFITGENTRKAMELTLETTLEDLREVFS